MVRMHYAFVHDESYYIVDRPENVSRDVAPNCTYGEIACIAHNSKGRVHLGAIKIGAYSVSPIFNVWEITNASSTEKMMEYSLKEIGSLVARARLWDFSTFESEFLLQASTSNSLAILTGNLLSPSKSPIPEWEAFLEFNLSRFNNGRPKERVDFFEKQESLSQMSRVGEEVKKATIGSSCEWNFTRDYISKDENFWRIFLTSHINERQSMFARHVECNGRVYSKFDPNCKNLSPINVAQWLDISWWNGPPPQVTQHSSTAVDRHRAKLEQKLRSSCPKEQCLGQYPFRYQQQSDETALGWKSFVHYLGNNCLTSCLTNFGLAPTMIFKHPERPFLSKTLPPAAEFYES
ncbi:hypothetical protein Tco_0078537 [Tanacetum coccineum]